MPHSHRGSNVNNKFKTKKSKCYGLINVMIYLLLLPCFAHAGVLSTLSNVLGYLTGPFGKVAATLAIVCVGIGCFVMGKLSKMWVVAVVLGIGIVFGANGLLNVLTS